MACLISLAQASSVFGNAGFSSASLPIVVASLSSDISTSDNVFIRATAKTASTAEIEIKLGTQKTTKTVKINYIAVQLKQV